MSRSHTQPSNHSPFASAAALRPAKAHAASPLSSLLAQGKATTVATCVAALFAIGASSAYAQSTAQTAQASTAASSPVNVQGLRDGSSAAAPRRDVSKVCPQAQADLPEVLASAWDEVGSPGVVRMRFTLDGQRIVDARAFDGPRSYHRFVRSAAYGLVCSNDRSGAQVFEMVVRFADPQALRQAAASGLATQKVALSMQ
jgi:hypothetical protein